MIVEIAEKIVNEFLENKVIDEEEKDVYKYGTELMVSQFIGIGIVLSLLCSTLICISYWSMPNMRTIIVYGALAICELAVLLIAGLVKNKRNAKEEKDDYSCNMR